MAIPEHADPRAHQFFERGFVGKSHGDDGSGWRYSWHSTTEGLHPTAIHTCARLRPICAYCGEHALPIQKDLGYQSEFNNHRDRYIHKGFTCCCSGAMDERDYVVLRETMLERHAQELEQLESAAPVPPLHIAQAYGRKAAEKALEGIDRWGCRDLNEINLKMGGPPKGNVFE